MAKYFHDILKCPEICWYMDYEAHDRRLSTHWSGKMADCMQVDAVDGYV
jgi:hypothetical protein